MSKKALAVSDPIFLRGRDNPGGRRKDMESTRLVLSEWPSRATPFVVHFVGIGRDNKILFRETGHYFRNIVEAASYFKGRCEMQGLGLDEPATEIIAAAGEVEEA